MRALFRMFKQNLLHNPVRNAVYLVVTTLISSFLCIGVSLHQNASSNLEALYNNFDVIACPDISINRNGNGVSPTTAQIPYFDLESVTAVPGVQSIDIRNQFGAYINHKIGDFNKASLASQNIKNDVIIFSIVSDNPICLPYGESVKVSISVKWSAIGLDPQVFSKTITIRNQSFDYAQYHNIPVEEQSLYLVPQSKIIDEVNQVIILEPDNHYIMTCEIGTCSISNGQITKISSLIISSDPYHSVKELTNYQGVSQTIPVPMSTNLLCIDIFTDAFWDTSAGLFFQQAIQCCQLNSGSLTAISTDDVSTILPFHQGSLFISEGSYFTPGDYESGEKVCLISDIAADICGFKVGDKVNLSFFETNYLFNGKVDSQVSNYDSLLFDDKITNREYDGYTMFQYQIDSNTTNKYNLPFNNFFDHGQFEIIGIYSGEILGSSHRYSNISLNSGMDWRVIIIPQKSTLPTSVSYIDNYNTSIRLDILGVQEFLTYIATSGLSKTLVDGYSIDFVVYDQGISKIAPGLRHLNLISKTIFLIACVIAVVLTTALIAIYLSQECFTIALLRSLGIPLRQIVFLVLCMLLLGSLIGIFAGTVIGSLLSIAITRNIVIAANAESATNIFTAVVTQGFPNFTIQAHAGFTSVAFIALLLWLYTAVLVILFIVIFSKTSLLKPLTARKQ